MKKTAFLFPGQGVQYTGMGKDFYEMYDVSAKVYERASAEMKFPVEKLCFERNEKLHCTEYTQIALLTTEIAMLRAVEQEGICADATAGLSLGEYGALAAAKVMTEEDLLHVVHRRGQIMQEAVPQGGAMAAVWEDDTEKVERICKKTRGNVNIAGYNCPGQVVISGEEKEVKRVSEYLKKTGAKRVVPLRVSGPFHSPMLLDAGRRLSYVLEKKTVYSPKIPYLSNVTADYVKEPGTIKKLLEKQVICPVRWQQTIEKMVRDGVDLFLEIGPGRTLTDFVKKISGTVCAMNIERVEDLQKVRKYLEK